MDPWFERWGLFGYRPINRKGVVTIILMGGFFLLLSAASIDHADSPSMSLLCGIGAVAAAIIGHWIVFTHMAD